MRRILLLLVLGVAVAIAIWYGVRGGRLTGSSSATVTSLLPKETLAFVHLPDLNSTRAKWEETDLYKLWREPSVQEFLQKPLSKMSKAGAAQQTLQELETLEIKDAFLALTTWENKKGILLAGFRFKGSAADADKIIARWRLELPENFSSASRETITHEQHRIEVVTEGAVTLATVYNREWCFAANDVATLKTLLDRADGRLKDQPSTLATDETFTNSFKRMPGNYALLAYARFDKYFESLSRQSPPDAGGDEELRALRQIRSVTAESRIENGKFRDVFFVAMPKRGDSGDLTRASLSLATTDSFLYSAGFFRLPSQMHAPGLESVSAGVQRLAAALFAAGVTLDDWNSTFGTEFGILANWKENARLPSFAVTLPVKDPLKAKTMMAAISAATVASGAWSQSEKEGVQYYSQPPLTPMLPIAPTVALSDRLFVLGQDPACAEDVVKRSSRSRSELAAQAGFKAAERLVAQPKHGFAYLDLTLLYQRLDAAVRPMLVMAAAFMPGISETVELAKLPSADVVTRHLSPVVMSQRYDTDGYLTESVGPLSLYQAGIGIALASGAAVDLYQRQMQTGPVTPVAQPGPTVSLPALPPPLPSASPEETP
ncbi:MAG: hypothetical protein ABJB49_08550 [Nitrospirota bacterium]